MLELDRAFLVKKAVKKLSFLTFLGAIQKIRVKIGGREGYSQLTHNVTVGEGGVLAFNT